MDHDTQDRPVPPAVFLGADRLASLGDTMFGVAMTLLPTTLLPALSGKGMPVLTRLAGMRDELTAVFLSFAISAAYWVSQQRRLALARTVGGGDTVLHLLFLFLIVLLPLTTMAFGENNSDAIAVRVYGAHLVLLATINLVLWHGTNRQIPMRGQLLASIAVLVVLTFGLVVGWFAPDAAQYIWFAAFAAPVTAYRLMGRQHRGRAHPSRIDPT